MEFLKLNDCIVNLEQVKFFLKGFDEEKNCHFLKIYFGDSFVLRSNFDKKKEMDEAYDKLRNTICE